MLFVGCVDAIVNGQFNHSFHVDGNGCMLLTDYFYNFNAGS